MRTEDGKLASLAATPINSILFQTSPSSQFSTRWSKLAIFNKFNLISNFYLQLILKLLSTRWSKLAIFKTNEWKDLNIERMEIGETTLLWQSPYQIHCHLIVMKNYNPFPHKSWHNANYMLHGSLKALLNNTTPSWVMTQPIEDRHQILLIKETTYENYFFHKVIYENSPKSENHKWVYFFWWPLCPGKLMQCGYPPPPISNRY